MIDCGPSSLQRNVITPRALIVATDRFLCTGVPGETKLMGGRGSSQLDAPSAARPWELLRRRLSAAGGPEPPTMPIGPLSLTAERSSAVNNQQRVLSHSKIDVRRETIVKEVLGMTGSPGARTERGNGTRIANRFERSFRLCGAGAEHRVSQRHHTVKRYGPRTDGCLDENRAAGVVCRWRYPARLPRSGDYFSRRGRRGCHGGASVHQGDFCLGF